jgi:DNA-binding response OmpR family regulator
VTFSVQPAKNGALSAWSDGSYDLSGKRILLIEDTETVRLATRLMLEKQGATVDEASTGVLGLSMALEHTYDLVLLALYLPEKHGDEVVRLLREGGHTVTVVGLTASTMPEETSLLIAAGADLVLDKPLRIGALKRALSELPQPTPERSRKSMRIAPEDVSPTG